MKTKKDYDREILRVKQSFLEDQIKYRWAFKHTESNQDGAYTFMISNQVISTVVRFVEPFGFLDTYTINRNTLEQCLQMQKDVENGLQ